MKPKWEPPAEAMTFTALLRLANNKRKTKEAAKAKKRQTRSMKFKPRRAIWARRA